MATKKPARTGSGPGARERTHALQQAVVLQRRRVGAADRSAAPLLVSSCGGTLAPAADRCAGPVGNILYRPADAPPLGRKQGNGGQVTGDEEGSNCLPVTRSQTPFPIPRTSQPPERWDEAVRVSPVSGRVDLRGLRPYPRLPRAATTAFFFSVTSTSCKSRRASVTLRDSVSGDRARLPRLLAGRSRLAVDIASAAPVGAFKLRQGTAKAMGRLETGERRGVSPTCAPASTAMPCTSGSRPDARQESTPHRLGGSFPPRPFSRLVDRNGAPHLRRLC